MKKRILVISFSDLKNDPRVYRALLFLKERYDVSAVGLNDPELNDIKFYPIRAIRRRSFLSLAMLVILYLFRFFQKIYWSAFDFKSLAGLLAGQDFDMIIANNVETLPLALSISKSAEILLDAHEYTPGEFSYRLDRRSLTIAYQRYLCKKYIRMADAMITVSDGIAVEYEKKFRMIRPPVVANAPLFADLCPSTVNSRKITLIHHGYALPPRKIEEMICMMDDLDDRFMLYLMLVSLDKGYYKKLETMAKMRSNVKMVKPVPTSDIVKEINRYDIGLYILPPSSFNNEYALPNKFFEFIQARLAIAIGSSPEMARYVRKYDCGVVSPSFDPHDMSVVLNKLTKERIEAYKERSNKAASELCYEKEFSKLDSVIGALLK